MMKKLIPLTVITCLFLSCSVQQQTTKLEIPKLGTEGHRGGRGLMPENTIPAMINTIDFGLTTIEMDTHISKDGKVLVAHDDYINPLFTYAPDGSEIPKADAKKYALFQMDYSMIRKFDVGSKPYPAYPNQKKMKAYMPLLEELIDAVQLHIKNTGKKQVWYDIETKCGPEGDGILNPTPEVFVKLLMDVIEKKGIKQFVIIQSFDKRTLQVLHKKYPEVKTSYLLSDDKKSFEENLAELGFVPFMYSMGFKSITPALVKACHEKGVLLNAWTPNTIEAINKLKALGVDAIISDYPNLLVN